METSKAHIKTCQWNSGVNLMQLNCFLRIKISQDSSVTLMCFEYDYFIPHWKRMTLWSPFYYMQTTVCHIKTCQRGSGVTLMHHNCFTIQISQWTWGSPKWWSSIPLCLGITWFDYNFSTWVKKWRLWPWNLNDSFMDRRCFLHESSWGNFWERDTIHGEICDHIRFEEARTKLNT